MKKFTVEISGESLRTLQREANYEYLQDELELQKMIEYVIRQAHQDQTQALKEANLKRIEKGRQPRIYPTIYPLNKSQLPHLKR